MIPTVLTKETKRLKAKSRRQATHQLLL